MQQIRTKLAQDKTQRDGKGYPLGIMQKIENWSYYQMVYAEIRICPWNFEKYIT